MKTAATGLLIIYISLLTISCNSTPETPTRLPPCNTAPPPSEAPRGVVGLNFSRDGRVLAAANADFTIKLWDVPTGQVFRTFRGHTNVLYKAIFSPDEKLLASCSRDFTARIWDVASGKELHTLKGHNCAVKEVAFSPDGKTLASVSNDGLVKLWDVATGRELRSLQHWKTLDSDASVYSVVFAPDPRLIFTGNGDGTISAWDATTGQEVNVWQAQDSGVKALDLSHQKQLLGSTGGTDYTVKIWNAQTGAEIRTLSDQRTPNLNEQVIAIAFSPDDKLLASSEIGIDYRTRTYSFSRTRVWDLATGKPVLTAGGYKFDINAVDFTPDGLYLVTTGVEGVIKFWDLKTGQEARSFTNQPDEARP